MSGAGKNRPLVVAVTTAHNGWARTRECLYFLAASDYGRLATILVDDGSTDGTLEGAAQEFPEVTVIPGDGSLWWAAAMNLGIDRGFDSGADYVFVINSDVLADCSAVTKLVERASSSPRTLVGSLILERDNRERIWCAGGGMRWPLPGEYMLRSGEPAHSAIECADVEWLPGMGTLIPRTLFEEIGGYDAVHMPQYLADTDFALRAREFGWRVVVEPLSRVFNDSRNTGGLGSSSQPLTVKAFLEILTSHRSPEYLPARFHFIKRHCPTRHLVGALFLRYFKLAAFGLRRMVWRHEFV